MSEVVKKEGFFTKVIKFFKGVKSELKKVVWPTWKQLLNNTWIVVVAILIIGLIIFGLDLLFQFLIMNLLLGA
ncbi:MAG: preprotein translocase subunit SecE [Clostridia bacterium]|nr:preprotein translocase subunit SecE [Clostridia bacterium]